VLLLVPARRALAPKVRATIRWMFAWWVKWFHASGVLKITWEGFDEPLDAGTIYIANHPTLIDAPVLLAQLPNAICIFKSALIYNPFVAPAAIMAGYASGDTGVDLIRAAAEKVASGCSLLIFPEGTRTTPGHALDPLKPGFALIAQRAQAPIRVITLRASRGLVPRGQRWWRPPLQLPASLVIKLEKHLAPETFGTPAEITAMTQERLASLAPIVPTLSCLCPAPTATSC
jgi:1-acyl-sn-glycerol-3-phosphate acyltransferase